MTVTQVYDSICTILDTVQFALMFMFVLYHSTSNCLKLSTPAQSPLFLTNIFGSESRNTSLPGSNTCKSRSSADCQLREATITYCQPQIQWRSKFVCLVVVPTVCQPPTVLFQYFGFYMELYTVSSFGRPVWFFEDKMLKRKFDKTLLKRARRWKHPISSYI